MKNLQIEDFVHYRYLSRLTWAPDAKCAAFVVRTANWDKNGYDADLWLTEPEGGACRRLTAGGDGGSFIWASAHELVFPALRQQKDRDRVKKGEKLTVFQKISIHGGEAAEHFRVPYQVEDAKLLADGRYVLLCRCHPEDQDLSLLEPEAREAALRRLEEEKDYEVVDEIPFWFNGKGFTNKKRDRLFLYNPADQSMGQITADMEQVNFFTVQGNRVAYVSNLFTDKKGLDTGAYVYNAESGLIDEVYPQKDYSIQWIEFWQDRFVLLGSQRKEYGNNQNSDFYTASNGKLELLCAMDEQTETYTNSDCRLGGGTGLMVAGDAIYYTACHHVQNVLRRIDATGQVETLIQMDDTVDGFDVAGAQIIYFGLGALTLQEVFMLEGGKPRQLTHLNTDALRDKKLSRPERCDAQGEWDTVEGFVMKPVDYDPSRTYPAILNIHGGPKTAFGDTLFHESQVWANRGYFVLLCNPWGSDGRGNRFADLRGKYGTVDYNDLMAFTDRCLEAYPQIDAQRVAVGGGSYGGFMTNWIIGHTNRFCSAVAQRSISNWIGKFGMTDIGYYFNADQMAATPWSDQEKMWWHSPLKYADQCVTPTLFIHSDEDYRCWLPEALQMFTALKYHGCPARLCMFRGENHELSRSGKPKHRVRRMKEIIDWYDRYCK